VADVVAEVAAGAPLKGIHNIAGPEIFSLDELGRITLSRKGDVLTDKHAHFAPTSHAGWLS
jgi:hypothetical protein